ncbi:XdhC family protein [Streptomyces sp. NPDC050085]|uniref:XdhC family protein n=1 Tax=Streptomyces sp. NPDC050085 TaxID=3365600 RepID=UPI003792F339
MTTTHEPSPEPSSEPSPDAVAHGATPANRPERTLVAVFDSPVAAFLLRYAADAGFRTVLVDPAQGRPVPADLDDTADIVVTDHHRPELGEVLRDALATRARWIGVMGKASVAPPHVPALRALGVPEVEIAKVHRPIGLNIGSRTPAEIAVATLAGLLADRNGKPGGFAF